MIKVWILTAVFNGGFAMTPIDTEAACRDALAALPIAIVESGECLSVEMIGRGSQYAPELAPLPVPKPGQSA